MNLIDYQNKITSEVNDDSVLSQTITICNILNGQFKDEDILKITRTENEYIVETANENVAEKALQLNDKIVPGAFVPFYSISISRESCSLKINLNEF